MNPHALAGTSPSSWRVCQFRHSDVPPGQVRIGGQATAHFPATAWPRGTPDDLEEQAEADRGEGEDQGREHGDPVQVLLHHG